jgi:hypothetical protein
MSTRRHVGVLIAVLAILVSVAIPPLFEDHLEPGFCSADCPVQHAGHGAAIAPPARPSAARRPAPIAPAVVLAADADHGPVASPDAPRAPPAA